MRIEIGKVTNLPEKENALFKKRTWSIETQHPVGMVPIRHFQIAKKKSD